MGDIKRQTFHSWPKFGYFIRLDVEIFIDNVVAFLMGCLYLLTFFLHYINTEKKDGVRSSEAYAECEEQLVDALNSFKDQFIIIVDGLDEVGEHFKFNWIFNI